VDNSKILNRLGIYEELRSLNKTLENLNSRVSTCRDIIAHNQQQLAKLDAETADVETEILLKIKELS